MGLRARKIYALSLLLLLAAALPTGNILHAQDLSSGSYTVLKRYIFPRYSGKGEIQYLVYGMTAVNKGSLIYLTNSMIDIVDGSYPSIRQIDTIDKNDKYPTIYKLGSGRKAIDDFWKSSHHRHSQAWIFADKATFDKSTNILTSDETAHFRSRQLDADGDGFDAFNDRKFIHIRSNIHAIIHFKDDKNQTPDDLEAEEEEQGFGSLFSSKKPADVKADSADIDLENNIITLIGNVTVDDQKNRIVCDKMEISLEEDATDTLIGSAEKPADASGTETKEETPPAENKTDDKAGDEDDEDDEHSSIHKIVCLGNVVCTMKDGSDGQETEQIALCEKAEYDVQKKVVVMTGAHSTPGKVIPDAYSVMERQISRSILSKSPMMMQKEDWMIGNSFTIFIKEDNRLKVDEIKVKYTGSLVSMRDEANAEETDDEQPVVGGDNNVTMISADKADINIERNFILLIGNVDVDDQSSKITCREMEIRLKGEDEESTSAEADAPQEEEKEETSAQDSGEQEENLFGNKSVSKVICKDDVVYMERPDPDDPEGENRIAMADRADYDAVQETILLTGNSVMMQGANRLHGETIAVYSQEDNRVKVSAFKAYLKGSLLSSDEEGSSGSGTTMITARTADIRPNDKITLSQNVVVDDESGRITCSEMDVFLQKDASNSLFSMGKLAKKNDADEKTDDVDQAKNDITKIVCSGNVVYRKQSDGQEQVVLARKADYDAINEVIVMSGAHTAPQAEVSRETYAEIKRSLGKESAASDGGIVFDPYSILMQGDNWIAGAPITIYPKKGNRMMVTNMKASLRRSSRTKNANGEGK